MSGQFSKKERQEERRQRAHWLSHFKKIAIPALILGGIIGFFIWLIMIVPPVESSDIIARRGIHWHSELAIYVDGQSQEIPADIGLGSVHNPIHTHDDVGLIHLEFSGLVLKNNLRLDNFFKIWGRKFNKDCMFDYCNGPGGTVRMIVNGMPNSDFENYEMHDKDKIEIRYE